MSYYKLGMMSYSLPSIFINTFIRDIANTYQGQSMQHVLHEVFYVYLLFLTAAYVRHYYNIYFKVEKTEGNRDFKQLSKTTHERP